MIAMFEKSGVCREQQKLLKAAIPGINSQVALNKCERLTELKAFW